MLIRKIEENKLYTYDKPLIIPEKTVSKAVLPKPDTAVLVIAEPVKEMPPVTFGEVSFSSRTPRILENNRIQYIIVRTGETIESLEEDFELLKWELTRYNELANDFIPEPGQILYLQPKRDRAEPGKETHIAKQGETMYQISQKYGVKLRKLYEYNLMNEGENPVTGQKVWLRTVKPVN
jgi:LysM repeat protein